MNIQNVKIINDPMEVRKLGLGSVYVEVILEGTKMYFQIDKTPSGNTIFWNEEWQIGGTDLREVVARTIQWEINREEELARLNELYPYEEFDTKKFRTTPESDKNEIPF